MLLHRGEKTFAVAQKARAIFEPKCLKGGFFAPSRSYSKRQSSDGGFANHLIRSVQI